MTSTPPPLIDRAARQRNIARAARLGGDLFLHHLARDEIEDRLSLVNRAFTAPAIVTPFPQVWENSLPQAKILNEAETLPVDGQSYDLIIHAMSLHWSNDPVGQIIQCRQALQPDGLFLAIALGGETLTELRAALQSAESQVRGGLSPRVSPMGELRQYGALLQRAGLALPVADQVTQTASYQSAYHVMQDLRAMGEGNALTGRDRHGTRRQIFDAAAKLYAKSHGQDDGRITATFDLIVLTGWAPDASQPKPLRPGSATARLEDVLQQVTPRPHD